MLIQEKIRQTNFSDAEQNVINYILNRPQSLNLTIKEVAEAAFVHPSTLIRIAKKLDFTGWLEFKTAFSKEQDYLTHHFQTVDANLPFAPKDGLLRIASKLAQLEQTTISDTLSLLQHDALKKAKELLLSARITRIFGNNANTLIAQDFAVKMNRIGKIVTTSQIQGETAYEAYNLTPSDAAILISYTGENKMILQTTHILSQQHVPIIAITSIGDNSLMQLATCTLQMTTRERLYSKIGNFTTNLSITYLLDVLYSVVFAENYQQELDHLIKIGQQIDHRQISSTIMAEKKQPPVQIHDSFTPN